MSKERQPTTVVLYIELEDNVGTILNKKKLQIPVKLDKAADLLDDQITRIFDEYVQRLQSFEPELSMS